MTLALRFVYDNSPRVFSIVPVRNSSIFEAIILQEISGRAYLLFMGLYRFALSAWFEENIYYIWKNSFLSLSLSFSFVPCLTFSTHSSFLSHTWPHKNWVQGRIEADTQKHRHGKRMEWFLRFSYNQNRMDLKTTCTMMAKQSQMQ